MSSTELNPKLLQWLLATARKLDRIASALVKSHHPLASQPLNLCKLVPAPESRLRADALEFVPTADARERPAEPIQLRGDWRTMPKVDWHLLHLKFDHMQTAGNESLETPQTGHEERIHELELKLAEALAKAEEAQEALKTVKDRTIDLEMLSDLLAETAKQASEKAAEKATERYEDTIKDLTAKNAMLESQRAEVEARTEGNKVKSKTLKRMKMKTFDELRSLAKEAGGIESDVPIDGIESISIGDVVRMPANLPGCQTGQVIVIFDNGCPKRANPKELDYVILINGTDEVHRARADLLKISDPG